ncbi:MAG: fatty acid desaturase [Myxococcota bacterium]
MSSTQNTSNSTAEPENLIDEDGYIVVDYPEPHRSRMKKLIKEHPEIKELFGENPWTAVIAVSVVAAQVGLAWFFGSEFMTAQPLWVLVPSLLATAWLVGAFMDHSLFAIVHEVSHKRVFRGRLGNEIVGWIANMPFLVPSSSSFRNYHLKHHRFQGDPEFDADLASKAEAEWVGNSTVKKLIWQLFYPLFQTARTSKFQKNGKIPFWTKWVVMNALVVFAFDAAIIYFLGWWSLAYLAASFVFSLGLHPLSARLVQEHFVFKETQETYSYYGPANKVSLNVFHHNEHHDFPAVPWNKLPELRRICADFYEEELYHHPSLFKLWIQFLFDSNVTLKNRVLRDYSSDADEETGRKRALPPAAE